jgi:hypothetical protein
MEYGFEAGGLRGYADRLIEIWQMMICGGHNYSVTLYESPRPASRCRDTTTLGYLDIWMPEWDRMEYEARGSGLRWYVHFILVIGGRGVCRFWKGHVFLYVRSETFLRLGVCNFGMNRSLKLNFLSSNHWMGITGNRLPCLPSPYWVRTLVSMINWERFAF